MTEVHDCFSITELVTMEDLGLSDEGKAVQDVLDGVFDADGRVPCQIDGGLKCFGHPIGASGMRMLYEIYLQLQGRAGARQLARPEDRADPQPGRPAVAERLLGLHRRPGRRLSMADPVVLLDRPAPHVARLRINRPDKRNAIDHDVRQGFIDHLQACWPMAGRVHWCSAGSSGVFSAGGDVPSMVGLSEAQARERMRHIHVLCRLVAGARLPVVSAMEGFTAGAAVGLALLGDRIVVGRNARILFPFLKLGLAPDWGQLLTLPRRVGLPVARRLLSDGQPVTGNRRFASAWRTSWSKTPR